VGHDIYALKSTEKSTDRLYESYKRRGSVSDEDYKDFEDEAFVAQFRRSAFDTWNILLYRALGCEDLYNTVSGACEARTFTRVEIKAALDSLPGLLADQLPTYHIARLEKMKAEAMKAVEEIKKKEGLPEDTKFEIGDEAHESLDLETEFLHETYMWMITNERDEIDIWLG